MPVRSYPLEEVIIVFRQTLSAAVMAATLLPGVIPGIALAQPPTRNFTFMAHKHDYVSPQGFQNYSACWSYVHSDGREYAAIGVNGNSPPGEGPRSTGSPIRPPRSWWGSSQDPCRPGGR